MQAKILYILIYDYLFKVFFLVGVGLNLLKLNLNLTNLEKKT